MLYKINKLMNVIDLQLTRTRKRNLNYVIKIL